MERIYPSKPDQRNGSVWALIAAVCLCFCGMGVQAQPDDGASGADRSPQRLDRSFAWVGWFETQGRGYLREAMPGRPLPWDTPASRRYRDEAIAALIDAAGDPDDQVRAAGVLGLARTGYESLADRILPNGAAPNLLLDPSLDVRVSSMIALGLLQTENGRAALASVPPEGEDPRLVAAQALAIGLLTDPGKVHLRWLLSRLDGPDESIEVKRWCLWAMQQHDTSEFDPVYTAALDRLPSTFAISQVLMNPAYTQRMGGAAWLVPVLRYDPRVRQWAGYRALAELPVQGVNGVLPRDLAMQTRIACSLNLSRLPLLRKQEQLRQVLGMLRRRMIAGNTDQAFDQNRGYDTLGYFLHCNLEQGDAELLYEQMRGITHLSPEDPGLLAALGPGATPSPRDLQVRQSENPVRGYAAIAAGLMIRRATEGTALFKDRPFIGRQNIDIERLKRRFGIRLMRAVADPDEPMGYRAACALALGLSGEDRYKAELAIELGKLRGGDEAVLGYGLLSLAMLGDGRVVEPAKRYLTREGELKGLEDRLGRRAALWAVGIVGEQGGADGKAALAGARGLDPLLDISVAQASAWSGHYDAVTGMLEALKSQSAIERRSAAIALGLVFDRDAPSRLSALVQGINPSQPYRVTVVQQGPAPPVEALPPRPLDADWPIGQLHAIGDPFVIDLLKR